MVLLLAFRIVDTNSVIVVLEGSSSSIRIDIIVFVIAVVIVVQVNVGAVVSRCLSLAPSPPSVQKDVGDRKSVNKMDRVTATAAAD